MKMREAYSPVISLRKHFFCYPEERSEEGSVTNSFHYAVIRASVPHDRDHGLTFIMMRQRRMALTEHCVVTVRWLRICLNLDPLSRRFASQSAVCSMSCVNIEMPEAYSPGHFRFKQSPPIISLTASLLLFVNRRLNRRNRRFLFHKREDAAQREQNHGQPSRYQQADTCRDDHQYTPCHILFVNC